MIEISLLRPLKVRISHETPDLKPDERKNKNKKTFYFTVLKLIKWIPSLI